MAELRRQSRLRRLLVYAALLLGAAVVVIAAALAFIMYPVWKSYPDADFPPAASQADGNRQDLDYLRNLPKIDRSFTTETRAAFEQALDELMPRAADLDRAKLTLEVARLTALADNGHTNVVTRLGDRTFKSVPIRLGIFADGLFVVKIAGDNRDLPGAQVLAVNGQASDILIASFRPFIGGPAALLREHAPRLIVSPELLHAAGLGDSAEQSSFRFRLADGSEIDRVLTADIAANAEDNAYWPLRDLSPVPTNKNNAGWTHVLAEADAVPLYLSRPDQNYWHVFLADGKLLYLQINRMQDEGAQPLAEYLNGVVEEIRGKGIKYVVVDLRFNRGGNYLLAADFARLLPETLSADGLGLKLINFLF